MAAEEGTPEEGAEPQGEGVEETGGEGEQGGSEPDWKAEARKHERRAKQTAKEVEALRAKQAEIDEANKTEQEKALEAARAEARAEALTEADKERRSDRLEVAVTRAAAKTFEDPEDALVQIERAINRGEIDAEDIFDDQGKVQTEALKKELEQLLERKPHLAAAGGESKPRFERPSGAGKGASAGKDIRAMTPEDHLKRIQAKA